MYVSFGGTETKLSKYFDSLDSPVRPLSVGGEEMEWLLGGNEA